MSEKNHHRLCRNIVAVVTPLCLILAASPAWALTQARVNVSVANIRGGPGTSYNLAGQAKLGMSMEVLEKKGDWVKVKLSSGGNGWVSAKLVDLKNMAVVTPVATPVVGQASISRAEVTGSIVNVRSGPGTGSSVLGQLKRGYTAEVVEKSGEWYKIKLTSGSGWVFGELLKIHAPVLQQPQGSDSGTKNSGGSQNNESGISGNGVINGSFVNIRNGPGTGHEILTMASRGQRFPLVNRSQDWYQVRTSDNKIGWVAAWLVDVDAAAPVGAGTDPNVPAPGGENQEAGGDKPTGPGVSPESEGQVSEVNPVSGGSEAQPGEEQQVESAEVDKPSISLEGKNTLISIEYSGQLTDYNIFRLSNPSRLVIDLEGARPQRQNGTESRGDGLVKEARMSWYGQKPDVTRLVLDLAGACSYEVIQEKGEMIVKLLPPGPGVPIMGSTLVLDPGHGGSDPGAIGAGGLMEKEVTLDLAKRTAKLLQAKGAKVLLTREDDTYVDLYSRPEVANQAKAQLFLSIHINANLNRQANGTSTYFMSNTADRQERLQLEGEALANYLQDSLAKDLDGRDIGVLQANYAVLRTSKVPAALVEVVFISNPQEEALLQNDKFKDKVAKSIAQGIEDYFEGDDTY